MKKTIISLLFIFFYSLVWASVTVTPYGAAGIVSGSCFLVSADEKKIVVDCGIFMEKVYGDSNYSFPDGIIEADALILTHAHLDHSGKIPLLIDKGFQGKIYATEATKELALTLFKNRSGFNLIKRKWFWSQNQASKAAKYGNSVVAHWRDECKSNIKEIAFSENKEYLNILGKEKNIQFVICKECCKYESEKIANYFAVVKYNQEEALFEDIKIKFINAAHIPGSASVILSIKDKKVLFSGDLGSGFSRFNGAFDIPEKVDCVFVEATYADKKAKYGSLEYDLFRKDLSEAIKEGKIIWIPSLSFNRAQKILYEIKLMQDENGFPKNIPIYSVSPSANEITRAYEKEIAKKEGVWFLKEVYEKGTLMPAEAKLQPVRSYDKQMILLSSSGDMDMGMSEGIMHKMVPNRNVFIMIVNYVSPESNAGMLLSNKRTKEGVRLRAEIKKYDIFSDHPDFETLQLWLSNQDKKTKIYLIHSENKTMIEMERLMKKNGWTGVLGTMINNKINVFH